MTTFNNLPVFIHSVTEENGVLVAVVNKGSAPSPFTFKVKASKVEGLGVA